MSFTFLDERADSAHPTTKRAPHYHRWGKRALDIVVVILIAPFALLVVLAAWLLTILDGGKGFFSQPRIGMDGRVFRCKKIRTMVPDADVVLDNLINSDAGLAKEWRVNQKLKNDPRVTRLGRVLRQTSIDELPQLWNVLIGEMSLIGPRPFTPRQKELYDAPESKRAYYRMRPGITGLWQVDCRNSSEFRDRVTFDESYAKNLTLWLDLKIAVRTIAVIFAATGT